MLTGRASRFDYFGLARSTQYVVSSSETGQLETLLVDVYDQRRSRRHRGQARRLGGHGADRALAGHDPSARRRAGRRAGATASGGQPARRSSWTNNLRRFKTDEEDRRLAALELRVTIESDEIELERLDLELQRAKPRCSRLGLIDQQEYDSIRLLHDSVRTRMSKRARSCWRRPRANSARPCLRRESFEEGLAHDDPRKSLCCNPLREAIEVENQRLREIQYPAPGHGPA